MSTTLAQRETALSRANHVRHAVAELRLELAAGAIDLADAIHDERADRMSIHRLLCTQRQWGPQRASALCRRLMVSELRRCQELTLRQKGEIVAEVQR